MENSPFIYGTTVSAGAFTDREEDSKKLYHNLISGINTTIISPRRWGKSSLVEKVISLINQKEKKTKTLILDLFSVSSEEEFLERFAVQVIKSSSSKWNDWVNSTKDFFKRLIPKISIGVDPSVDFNISFDVEELKANSEEILNLPEEIAKKKNIKLIICLDEFQNLATFENYEHLEKKMRAAWQRHQHATYCLFGSKRHIMSEIFNEPSKPFYRFGDLMLLQKIHTKSWVKFIMKKFRDTNKKISPKNAEKIPTIMKNHSWYVQQFANYIWNKTKNEVTDEIILSALKELIYANMPLYQKDVENLSGTQLNLLKAIVAGESQLTSNAVMQKYRIGTPRNVLKNKDLLIKNDMIDQRQNTYQMLDPAFELWFKNQFFGFDFSKVLTLE